MSDTARIEWLRAADYPRMPWKNGKGSTVEVCCDQASGDLQHFGWRVSIADITEAGEFSRFDGFQRIISVITGNGMTLAVDDAPAQALTLFDAFAFSGDSEVACQLVDGPIQDFNLIYAPTLHSARLQWLHADAPSRLFTSARTVLVFSMSDGLHIQVDGAGEYVLGRHDCLRIDKLSDLLALQCSAAVALSYCLIELNPR